MEEIIRRKYVCFSSVILLASNQNSARHVIALNFGEAHVRLGLGLLVSVVF
jgi:hypothetical protein